VLALFLFLPILTVFVSCNRAPNAKEEDTPTTGTIKIAADETTRPLTDAWLASFQELYPQAKIEVTYLPETELFRQFAYDSVFFVIAAREPRKEETDIFEKKYRPAQSTKLAYDAIALVVNNSNSDTMLTIERIFQLLTDKISKWNQLNPESKNKSDVNVLFDGNKSSIVRYFSDTLSGKKITYRRTSVLKSCKEVINAVAKDKNALGFINLAWISDSCDTTDNSFLSSVRVVEVSPPDSSDAGGAYYKPFLANLALQRYPFMRSIYALNTEGRVGLATGFAAFMAGEKGQRIVLKGGLLPATMPIRLVKFSN
jgi:phosphate transport system substrate-binding protein